MTEAVVNYVALLGWSHRKDNQEIFSLEELVKAFDFHRYEQVTGCIRSWKTEVDEWGIYQGYGLR